MQVVQCCALPRTGDLQLVRQAALLRRGGDLVLVDDLKWRQAARRLGLSVKGTLGVLVDAKRSGLFDAVGPLLRSLQESGFRISPEVSVEVLLTAGESANDP